MKRLWAYIDGRDWTERAKFEAASWILGAAGSVLGLILWLVLRTWTLKTVDWMICFIGYPFVISRLFVFCYSCRHSFHSRTSSR